MNKLISWKTPFTESSFPSVGLYLEYGEYETDLVTAVVAPDGIDEYPKFLLKFGEVLEIKYYEEGCTPDRGYEKLLDEVKGLSAYEWLGSPSVDSYQDLDSHRKLRHFILFGADNILEVVTANSPEITKLSGPSKIKIELNV